MMLTNLAGRKIHEAITEETWHQRFYGSMNNAAGLWTKLCLTGWVFECYRTNDVSTNGVSTNGVSTNGVSTNDVSTNDVSMIDLVIDSIKEKLCITTLEEIYAWNDSRTFPEVLSLCKELDI
jgi:hypothetical protein